MTPNRYARLSDDRMSVLCGREYPTGHHCETELAKVSDVWDKRYLAWDSDWEQTEDRIRRSGWERKKRGYAPTREGWAKTLGGHRVKPKKAFGFELQAECPQCHLLNIIDAVRLDVREVPLSE